MIGDNAKGVIANSYRLSNPTRVVLNINCLPLNLGESPETNPNLISTTGLYNITYRKLTLTGEQNKKRFCLRYDFGRGFVKFSNYRELLEYAKTNEHVRFLLKYTNIQEHMLELALQNEGMQIPVGFDMCKYDLELREKLGIKDKSEYHMFYNPYKPNFVTTVDEAEEIYLRGVQNK